MSRHRGGGGARGDSAGEAPRFDRKQAQLAAQVARSLEQSLVGEFEDEVLQNLEVREVAPAKGGRMLATLVVHPPGSQLGREQVLERLEHARPVLMQQLARDLSRRALPEISFWVVRDPTRQDEAGEPADDDPSAWGYDPFA